MVKCFAWGGRGLRSSPSLATLTSEIGYTLPPSQYVTEMMLSDVKSSTGQQKGMILQQDTCVPICEY